jgi:hypothetical protein
MWMNEGILPRKSSSVCSLGIAIGRIHVNRHVTAGEVLCNTEIAQVTGFPRKPVQTMEYPFEIQYSFNFRWGPFSGLMCKSCGHPAE